MDDSADKGRRRHEVRNGMNDESKIICTVSKSRGKWKTKEIGNHDVKGNGEREPKVTSSRRVAKTYKST